MRTSWKELFPVHINFHKLTMIYNDNSKDPNKTAWCTTLHPCNEVFIEVHAAIAHKLGNLLSQPAGQAPGLARLRFVVRGPHSFIKKLWDFVPGDSITKEWQFYVDNLQVKRLHSATIFRCAFHYLTFVNYDHRLLFNADPFSSQVSFFLPVCRFNFDEICPPGVLDPTDIIQDMQDKVSSYNLWLNDMQEHHPNIRVLRRMSGIDWTDIEQFGLFPLHISFGNCSFQTVFVPAFEGGERDLGKCKLYRLGSLMFGPNYTVGSGFDVELRGYFFAVPVNAAKTSSSETFFFRTCRHFGKLNWDSEAAIPLGAVAAFYLKPCIMSKETKTFSILHRTTLNAFGLSDHPHAFV